MSEIKFRGYCERDSEWRYGFYVTDGKTHEILTKLKCGSMYASQISPESLGQYTGIKDKNGQGTEMCQGDIVYGAGHGNGVVERNHWGEWGLKYKDDFISIHDLVIEGDLGEIQGNIHDDPDLLK